MACAQSQGVQLVGALKRFRALKGLDFENAALWRKIIAYKCMIYSHEFLPAYSRKPLLYYRKKSRDDI